MNGPMKNIHEKVIEENIAGSFSTRFWIELFGNSAYFAIANILLELLIEGTAEYLRAPDLYTIVFAAAIQAYWLTRQSTSRPHRLIGNLIALALYSLTEGLLEVLRFFCCPAPFSLLGFCSNDWFLTRVALSPAIALYLARRYRKRCPHFYSLFHVRYF
jgi:hypothetical protein